jgi:hypothetical protein
VCKARQSTPNIEDAFAVDRLHEITMERTVMNKAVLVLVSIDVPLDHNSDSQYIRKRGEKESEVDGARKQSREWGTCLRIGLTYNLKT